MNRSHYVPSLQARLSKVALSVESGSGEADLLFQAAERINQLDLALRRTKEVALYLRSTMADVSALLAGEQIDPARHIDDPVAEAAIKATSAVRAVFNIDLGDSRE